MERDRSGVSALVELDAFVVTAQRRPRRVVALDERLDVGATRLARLVDHPTARADRSRR
jgi:hypothetical protein